MDALGNIILYQYELIKYIKNESKQYKHYFRYNILKKKFTH